MEQNLLKSIFVSVPIWMSTSSRRPANTCQWHRTSFARIKAQREKPTWHKTSLCTTALQERGACCISRTTAKRRGCTTATRTASLRLISTDSLRCTRRIQLHQRMVLAKHSYYMTQLDSYGLTGNINSFRKWVAAYRNAREWTQQQRDGFIANANGVARRQSTETRSFNTSGNDSKVSSDAVEEPSSSETSADELAPDYETVVKRQRRRTRD